MRRGFLVSLLGLAAVSGCASSHASGPAAAVPWVNRPRPLYRFPGPKLIRYPTNAPLCGAGQLRVSQGQDGAATGNDSEQLLFTNISSRPCLLRGYPTVSAASPGASRRTLHPRHGTFFGPYVPANLRPGRHVFLDFGTSSGCEGGDRPIVHYRDLVFTLPTGGAVAARTVSIWEQCGLDVSTFGLPAWYTPVRSPAGTPGALQATAHVPAQLLPGAKELDYVVRLSNPTATPVRLTPCPGYTQSVYTRTLIVHRSFALNCNSVHRIPAHGHVSYAMRLRLPHPLPAGRAIVKFGWSLDTPTGPFAGRALLVAAK